MSEGFFEGNESKVDMVSEEVEAEKNGGEVRWEEHVEKIRNRVVVVRA